MFEHEQDCPLREGPLDDQPEQLWTADPEPDPIHCRICGKELFWLGPYPGRLVCPSTQQPRYSVMKRTREGAPD